MFNALSKFVAKVVDTSKDGFTAGQVSEEYLNNSSFMDNIEYIIIGVVIGAVIASIGFTIGIIVSNSKKNKK